MKNIYCISDIHNDLDSFCKMLDLIKFTKDDEMYILGDIFDRGSDPFGLYKKIRNHENIFSIMGNHELSLARSIYEYEKYENEQRNDREPVNQSHRQLLKRLEGASLAEFLDWIIKMPFQREIVVEDRKYLLAHAGTTNPDEGAWFHFHLWGKLPDDRFWENGIEGYVSVVGHFTTNVVRKELGEKQVYPNAVWSNEKKNVYAIDCGNGYRSEYLEFVRLGCLRLNDHQCFYV